MERRAPTTAALLAFAAVGLLFAARFHAFLLGGTLYQRDAGFFFEPWRRLLPTLASDGFPLWNPFLSNGRAFAANPNAAVFWPLSPLLFVASPTVLTLLNVALLLVFFFLALRAPRLGPVLQDKRVESVILLTRDITERKLAEKVLVETQNQLEDRCLGCNRLLVTVGK